MMTYLLGRALVKGRLFPTAGILLHRLRAVGERSLFGKGKPLHWTAALWFWNPDFALCARCSPAIRATTFFG